MLTRIVLWWSSFTALTAAAFSYPSLMAVRFLFGVTEAGAWPNVAKTFSRWFGSEARRTGGAAADPQHGGRSGGGLATDYASRRFGLRWGRAGVGVVSCLGAGLAMVAGARVDDGVSAALLIAIAAASSNLMLGASWGSCIDIGGGRTGLIGGVMNTAGQVGGILSPIILAVSVRRFSSWAAPLYLTGLIYCLGAVAWCMVDASRSLWPEKMQPKKG